MFTFMRCDLNDIKNCIVGHVILVGITISNHKEVYIGYVFALVHAQKFQLIFLDKLYHQICKNSLYNSV